MTKNTIYIILTLYKVVLVIGGTSATFYFFISGIVKKDNAAFKNAGIVFVSIALMMILLTVIEFAIAYN
jgi:hypothetical protein